MRVNMRTESRRAVRVAVKARIVGWLLITGTFTLTANATCVPVYDATLYKNKPNLTADGFRPVETVDALGRWWGKGESRSQVGDMEHLNHWVAENHNQKAAFVILDIEEWPTTGDPTKIAATKEKLIAVADRVKRAGVTTPIGYYGILPNRDYWRATSNTSSDRFKSWQADNDAVAGLALHVDALFPSLYTFYDDAQAWKVYAIANLKEARRLAAGRPVYAYLWPQYHESNKTLALKYLPASFWKTELETVGEYADGMVIWGGAGLWNPDAEWWKVTSDYIHDHFCVQETERAWRGARPEGFLSRGPRDPINRDGSSRPMVR